MRSRVALVRPEALGGVAFEPAAWWTGAALSGFAVTVAAMVVSGLIVAMIMPSRRR